jgi:hypothetical protein
MKLITEKGLLEREETLRPQVCRPAETAEKTQLRLLDHLIRQSFRGSAMRLVLRASAAKGVLA